MTFLFSKYSTAVTAGWSGAIITAPKIIDGLKQDWASGNHIVVYEDRALTPAAEISEQNRDRNYTGYLVLRGSSAADLEKMIEANLSMCGSSSALWSSDLVSDHKTFLGFSECKMSIGLMEIVGNTSW